MKKTICLILASVLTLALFGCGENPEPTQPATEPATQAVTETPTEEPAPQQTEPAAEIQTDPTVPQEVMGVLNVDTLEHVSEENFGTVIRKTIDAEGEHVVLYTDGTLKNFRIEQGTMYEDGMIFNVESELFSMDKLNSDTLIVVDTYFGDVLPTLQVTYEGADGEETLYLSQSGRDGSIQLVDLQQVH